MFPRLGKNISQGISVFQIVEHRSLGIRVSKVGEHISLGIRVSHVGGRHITRDICFQVGEGLSVGICFPGYRGQNP